MFNRQLRSDPVKTHSRTLVGLSKAIDERGGAPGVAAVGRIVGLLACRPGVGRSRLPYCHFLPSMALYPTENDFERV
jgi:hypothetical protein